MRLLLISLLACGQLGDEAWKTRIASIPTFTYEVAIFVESAMSTCPCRNVMTELTDDQLNFEVARHRRWRSNESDSASTRAFRRRPNIK
jgi:hypothetical protein